MHRKHLREIRAVIAIAFVLAFVQAARAAAPCAPLVFEGAHYTVCTFDPRRDDIRTFWKDNDGVAYGSLSGLAKVLDAHGRKLIFAMNGGMYQPDLSPVGLYVEDGRELHRADTRGGSSNFRLKPNGVFYVADGGAGVMETSKFLASGIKPRYATQSGPMLVIDGRIHPRIRPTGTSTKTRNGAIVFAISEEPVTFHAFADLFRDGLNCPNALFLDGSISSLFTPDLRRVDTLWPLGPIIGVTTAK
jgi:uncharacterized protein YigE (DUF2233 family)